jgi:hypothetical protein
MQMAFLIGALVSAAACSAIASHKNRSTVTWGILGFLFGVFALIACAVLPSRARSAWS